MQVRSTDLEIPLEAPFTNCKLGRASLAEPLTTLVANSGSGLVMSVHAPWGQGKSTFFRMWHRHLINQGFVVVQFNAWETDYSDDPMTALVGELLTQWEDAVVPPGTEPGKVDLLRTQHQTSKRVVSALAKQFVPLALRVASAGLVDGNEVMKALVDGTADKVDEHLNRYVGARASINKFREQLKALAEYVQQHRDDKPLVFLVDELDRCRPDYALRVLECIKHFFSVSGVVFVLGIDKHQLRESSKAQYGQGMEAIDYLRRFFDIEFSLPMTSIGNFASSQLDTFGITELIANQPAGFVDHDQFQTLLPLLITAFDCSPRDVQRLMGQLNFVLRTWPQSKTPPMVSMFIVIAIRLKAEALYARLHTHGMRGESLWTALRESIPGVAAIAEKDESTSFEAAIWMMLATERERSRYGDRLQNQPVVNFDPNSREMKVLKRAFLSSLTPNWHSFDILKKHIDLSAYVEHKPT